MSLTSPELTMAWERMGFQTKIRFITPVAPALTWIAAQYTPPLGAAGYYAFIQRRITFGNILPGVFTYYLYQGGTYADTNLINDDTLRDGLDMFLTITRKEPLNLWVLNNDVVGHRFDFVLHFIIVQNEDELRRVRDMVAESMVIPAAHRKAAL